jgi:hypothetical protein
MSPPLAILLCGRTGSGKTWLTNRIAKASGKKIYAVEDRGDGDKEFDNISWDDLDSKENCGIVIDDLLKCKESQFEKLQLILNYAGSHKSVSPILICCHSINKTNVTSLLGYLGKVIFTLPKTNLQSVAAVLDYYKFDPPERKLALNDFKRATGEFGYFLCDADKHVFRRFNPEEEVLGGSSIDQNMSTDKQQQQQQPSLEAYRAAASRFLPELRNERAFVLFDFVLMQMPLSHLSPTDLTIRVKSRKTEKEIVLSLIDYLHAHLVPQRPSGEILRLDKFLKKYIQFPKIFVENKYLK